MAGQAQQPLPAQAQIATCEHGYLKTAASQGGCPQCRPSQGSTTEEGDSPGRRPYRRWHPGTVNALIQMYVAGMPVATIAERLNHAEGDIYRRLKLLRQRGELPRRVLEEER